MASMVRQCVVWAVRQWGDIRQWWFYIPPAAPLSGVGVSPMLVRGDSRVAVASVPSGDVSGHK